MLNVILQQKFEYQQKCREPFIKRTLQVHFPQSNLIQVITGPRRAGKSSYCVQLTAHLDDIAYLNFDDERLLNAPGFDVIMEAVNTVWNSPKHLLFDEIQNLRDWEIIVNRLQRAGYYLLITGSNSNLLSSELSTHLTGRHLTANLFPFSFPEILSISRSDLSISEKKQLCLDYMQNGGFPEPRVKEINTSDYLSILFDSILYKDIIKRHRVRYATALESIAVYLLSNIASVFSYRSLTGISRINSVHTLQKYINYLEDAFLFFTVPCFSFKLSEQQRSNKKIYCYDNGFYKAKAFYTSPDYGKLMENLVAVELKKRSLQQNFQFFFWKTRDQEEVDFVIFSQLHITQLIQVSFSLTQKTTMQREIRSLLKASKTFNCQNLLVITENFESIEPSEWFGTSGVINFIPLWKWLLEE